MLDVALALVPLLLLLGSLLCGRYPGIETIVRISERLLAAASIRRASRRPPRPRSPRVQAIRGGLLLALGLAQRPPPLAR
ncbi:MAG TPA: hypothetical protein VG898_03290 [Solirubrobacterales bacterium]|nr:hypothetical protein [Solirubrobacterales bacterium]